MKRLSVKKLNLTVPTISTPFIFTTTKTTFPHVQSHLIHANIVLLLVKSMRNDAYMFLCFDTECDIDCPENSKCKRVNDSFICECCPGFKAVRSGTCFKENTTYNIPYNIGCSTENKTYTTYIEGYGTYNEGYRTCLQENETCCGKMF